MITDNPNDEIRRQVADFERRTGRVPTIEELAKILEIDPRLLARRLKKSLITLGGGHKPAQVAGRQCRSIQSLGNIRR